MDDDAASEVLELLLEGAPRDRLDRVLDRVGDRHRDVALRLREQLALHRGREAELTALYETARDLTAIRDLDTILTAIVRRARQLLGADMTYLSLNDESEGASYMRVTDGALTPEFRRLRLPLGTGLLGLVAQSGTPYFTEDYQSDARFLHQEYIDDAVAGEEIRAILGVPLEVEGHVIGALLAVHRRVRPFPAREVALLTSFAAHAAVALENARLFERTRDAVAEADAASTELRARSEASERAAHAHDLLADVLLHRGGVAEVAAVLARVLGGEVEVYDDEGRHLAGRLSAPTGIEEAVAAALASGRCTRLDGDAGGAWVAVAAAGEDHLGTLALRTDGPMGLPERRTLERAALVTAMVLLFERTEAEAEARMRGELLTDLLSGRALDAVQLRERVRQHGARLEGGLALAVARHEPAGAGRAAARALARLAGERQGLAAVHEGHVVLVAAGAERELGEALRDRLGAGTTVGVCPVDGGLPGVCAAYAEARQARSTLVCLGRDGEVADPAGLGVARLLLGRHGPAELAEFLTRTLGPVLDYDAERETRLVETLQAWVDAGGGLRATAEQVHVHPNTVAQRLERVGQLLGQDWRDPARRLDLQLALQLVRLQRPAP